MVALLVVAVALGLNNFGAAIAIGVGGVDRRTEIKVATVFGLCDVVQDHPERTKTVPKYRGSQQAWHVITSPFPAGHTPPVRAVPDRRSEVALSRC